MKQAPGVGARTSAVTFVGRNLSVSDSRVFGPRVEVSVGALWFPVCLILEPAPFGGPCACG